MLEGYVRYVLGIKIYEKRKGSINQTLTVCLDNCLIFVSDYFFLVTSTINITYNNPFNVLSFKF